MHAEEDLTAARPVYLPDTHQLFTDSNCFLCGTTLHDGCSLDHGRTKEHVFPQWLLDHANLWGETLALLNGTTIPYRMLTIPSYRGCNSGPLALIEREVSRAVRTGYESVAALEPETLFCWMAKIYYGLLYRELSLPFNRAERESGPIVSPEFLKSFSTHHLLMQAARGVVEWDDGRHPASHFVFRCSVPEDPRLRFDYFDWPHFPFLSLRMGDVGLLAVLQDWGALQHGVEVPAIEAAKRLSLHPSQFRAITAECAYMTSLYQGSTSHLLLANGDRVLLRTVFEHPEEGLFAPFVVHDYAQVLAYALRQDVTDIYDGKRVVSVVMDGDGHPLPLDASPDDLVWFHL